MLKWYPIELAPKDYAVLGYDKNHDPDNPMVVMNYLYWYGWSVTASPVIIQLNPTHWCELPKKPKKGRK